MLTNHGCFEKNLHQTARREPTTRCHHCEADEDTTAHILEVCPAWAGPRCIIVDILGNDLSLPAVVSAMIDKDEAWRAVVSFCEDVILQKETAERERKRDPDALPLHRRRGHEDEEVPSNSLAPSLLT